MGNYILFKGLIFPIEIWQIETGCSIYCIILQANKMDSFDSSNLCSISMKFNLLQITVTKYSNWFSDLLVQGRDSMCFKIAVESCFIDYNFHSYKHITFNLKYHDDVQQSSKTAFFRGKNYRAFHLVSLTLYELLRMQ